MNVSVDLRTFQRYYDKNSAKLMLHMSIFQDDPSYLSNATTQHNQRSLPTLSQPPPVLPPQEDSQFSGLTNTLPPSPTAQRFRPYPSNVHHVTKGRYITSNDPRGYIPVYEYQLNGQWIMMDVDDGYILWTGIWKALGNAKADIVKMIESQPDLAPQLRRVRGGFLKIQGTWMPHEVAVKLSQRVAFPIKDDLIPFFGPNFPDTCLRPDQPGYGQVIPSTSGRRKTRKATTSINTKGIRPSIGQPASAPLPSSSSFTLPSAGLSLHGPGQSHSLYQYGHGSHHGLASASPLDYHTPLPPQHRPISISGSSESAPLQHHPIHSDDMRPSSAPVSSHVDNILYNLYSQQGQAHSHNYSFSPSLSLHHSARSDAEPVPPFDSQRYTILPEEQRPSSTNYGYQETTAYVPQQQQQPLSAGGSSIRSDRSNASRSQHRYLPYPHHNPVSPTYNTGHIMNPNPIESTYSSLASQNYQFPPPSSASPISGTTQSGPSPTLTHMGYSPPSHSPRHANVSPTDDRMRSRLTPLAASTDREAEPVHKVLADSLAYSLPPISSIGTSRNRDKADSAAVLKRLRTDLDEGRDLASREKSAYTIPIPEARLGRRRSLSEPPPHAGLLINQTSASPSSTWTHTFSDSQGEGQTTNNPYASLHTHFTHHRANSGGMDSSTTSQKVRGAFYARPPEAALSHPLPPSRDNSTVTSPISPGTTTSLWSDFGDAHGGGERHSPSRQTASVHHQSSSHVMGSIESSMMQSRQPIPPHSPYSDLNPHVHLTSRTWTADDVSENPIHTQNGGSNVDHAHNR